ncbi:MAG: hypothetical protein ACLTW7_03735 [Enterococcus sp.]|uniref:hypothetical protein n=1 Tax=Enterococcus sp. TaxID=35783 RepID=UPI000ECB5BA2|nr:hypothetical protein [Enterococcus sp.]
MITSILEASRTQLLTEIYEAKKMLYRILNLPTESQSLISMSISPFLSLLCEGIDNLFSEDDVKFSENYGLIYGMSFTKLMNQNRASVKLLTDKKITRAIKTIDKQLIAFNQDLVREYNLLQRDYISMFGQPDLGIYFFENVAFSNTSQLSIYQDMFRQIAIDNLGNNTLGFIIRDFSASQANSISSFASAIEGKTLPKIDSNKCKLDISDNDFSEKDFIFIDERKRNIFLHSENKNLSLYLFNIKCQMSFALKLAPKIIDRNHALRFRVEIIAYYQSMKTIDFLIKKGKLLLSSTKMEILDKLLINFNNIFSDNYLRNNIYHYRFSDDNVHMVMKNDYFISMIEFQTRQDFNCVFGNIERDMTELIEVLDEITALV